MRSLPTCLMIATVLVARIALAQEAEAELPVWNVHGFLSQGAFVSTANDYLGHSERGSVELTEAGINFSSEVADRLRAGLQLFTRDVGFTGDFTISLDWAYLDYRWREWLGLRAGRVKLPFGLYNEYSDIDSARLPILLPQSVYPITNRDFLLAQNGFALYGSPRLGTLGALDYQLYGGTIFIDAGSAPEIRELDNKYVIGGQLFWRPPLPGLRVGGSALRGALAFDLQLDPATVEQLRMIGAVPLDFDGSFAAALEPFDLLVGSGEYATGPWLFSAEYSRWLVHTRSSLPAVFPSGDEDSERFYGMASYRLSDRLEAGAYYSVHFVDAGDPSGKGSRFAGAPSRAYQKDLAATVRFDVNEFWLWKIEAHYMHGTADLPAAQNPDPTEHWGFVLARTTVSF